MQKINQYFERIGLRELSFPQEPTGALLKKMHRNHLLHIPFENLDIHLEKEIPLSIPSFYQKIVEKKRGGWCYEMNGLFYWVLTMLGYDADLITCQVAEKDGTIGSEFDHMAIIVRIEERVYLCDVGFGGGFLEPLPLEANYEIEMHGDCHKITEEEGRYQLWRKPFCKGDFELKYVFKLMECKLIDFADRSQYLQTSADSWFTQKRFCTKATPTGRVTLIDTTLQVRTDDKVHENGVANADYIQVLEKYFGISLWDSTEET